MPAGEGGTLVVAARLADVTDVDVDAGANAGAAAAAAERPYIIQTMEARRSRQAMPPSR